MSRIRSVRRLATYDRKVLDAFVAGAKRLGWKRSTAEQQIGHHTIKDTLVHILNVHEAWFVASAQDKWDVFSNPIRRRENVRSFQDLENYQRLVRRGTAKLMADLTESGLDRRVSVPWMPGRYTLEDAFYQVSFEQAHHLGEIIGVYWQMNRAPPQMMWLPTLLGTRVSVR